MENPLHVLTEEYPESTLNLTNWLVRAIRDGEPIVQTAKDYFTSDSCLSLSTYDQQRAMLKGFGQKLIAHGHPMGEQCLKAHAEVEQFREDKVGCRHRLAIPLSREAGLQYIRGLNNPKAAAVSALALEGGLAYSDILRDTHRLSKAHDGVVEVGKRQARRSARQAAGRTVEFNAEILHEMDPYKEVIGVLSNVFFDPQRGRELQIDVFQPFMKGAAYTVDQLRAANAIHRLQRGSSLKEVAEFQGVQPISLEGRLNRYCTANGIERPF